MLDTVVHSQISVDALEHSLIESELLIGRIRAHQTAVLAALDVAQVPQADGARSVQEWVAGRLDVARDTARVLVEASKLFSEDEARADQLACGEVSFDRAVATSRLASSGAPASMVARSEGYDLAGVSRLVARHRRVTRSEEADVYRDRFVAIQPSLDDLSWRLWGQLPAVDGRIVEAALEQRADELPAPVERGSRTQRNADALVSIAQDSIDGGAAATSPATPVVSVFIDASVTETSNGEAGAELASGPRAGPAVLERILCEGSVHLVVTDGLQPIAASATSRAIPPAIRRFVLHRDGACVIDGCGSRYRLQPHHVVPWSEGGAHDATNLATLCWYHHHVAIHGAGFRLDPGSPPQRRRLLPPARGPD